MRAHRASVLLTFAAAVICAGCGTYKYRYSEPAYTQKPEQETVLKDVKLDPALEDRILALDPDRVTAEDVKNTLSRAGAPQIVNVHGGIYPVYQAMESFGKFLVAMGYPENRVRNPGDGTYSFSCYDDSDKIAGVIAWYYEKQGMRPMMVGHSQGGMQAIKVLHELAGDYSTRLRVWNPLTGQFEKRAWIVDPLTGAKRPVIGIQLSYTSAVGAGGLTRFMPNQWSIGDRLRVIPDTTIEFTGFYKHLDILGGDAFGFGPGNSYRAAGKAQVRTVLLPFSHDHYFVPYTLHLAEHSDTSGWINSYVPSGEPSMPRGFSAPSSNIVWAADVWTGIKKHWVLELQRLIRAKRGLPPDAATR